MALALLEETIKQYVTAIRTDNPQKTIPSFDNNKIKVIWQEIQAIKNLHKTAETQRLENDVLEWLQLIIPSNKLDLIDNLTSDLLKSSLSAMTARFEQLTYDVKKSIGIWAILTWSNLEHKHNYNSKAHRLLKYYPDTAKDVVQAIYKDRNRYLDRISLYTYIMLSSSSSVTIQNHPRKKAQKLLAKIKNSKNPDDQSKWLFALYEQLRSQGSSPILLQEIFKEVRDYHQSLCTTQSQQQSSADTLLDILNTEDTHIFNGIANIKIQDARMLQPQPASWNRFRQVKQFFIPPAEKPPRNSINSNDNESIPNNYLDQFRDHRSFYETVRNKYSWQDAFGVAYGAADKGGFTKKTKDYFIRVANKISSEDKNLLIARLCLLPKKTNYVPTLATALAYLLDHTTDVHTINIAEFLQSTNEMSNTYRRQFNKLYLQAQAIKQCDDIFNSAPLDENLSLKYAMQNFIDTGTGFADLLKILQTSATDQEKYNKLLKYAREIVAIRLVEKLIDNYKQQNKSNIIDQLRLDDYTDLTNYSELLQTINSNLKLLPNNQELHQLRNILLQYSLETINITLPTRINISQPSLSSASDQQNQMRFTIEKMENSQQQLPESLATAAITMISQFITQYPGQAMSIKKGAAVNDDYIIALLAASELLHIDMQVFDNKNNDITSKYKDTLNYQDKKHNIQCKLTQKLAFLDDTNHPSNRPL
jgi:hypothetical protein